MFALTIVCAVLAAIPALTFLANLRIFPKLPRQAAHEGDNQQLAPRVSLLIPARDEESSIGAALDAALATRGVDFEVVVLDDHSTDQTAAIVRDFVSRDPRVRLETAPPLPTGWRGKPAACAALAERARGEILVWIDADVRLETEGLARAVDFLDQNDADLVSGFPRQVTGTFWERLLIPLIHFVLLGFLPLARMRRSRHPAYGAAGGQLLLARRKAYEHAGGHAAIATYVHDGIQLARRFRAAGHGTDLFDATDVATCRMYTNGGQVFRGLAKNAIEGMGSPKAIVPWTLVLGLGQVAPPILLTLALAGLFAPNVLAPAALATALAYLPRLLATPRFRQSPLGALLHPFGIAVFLGIQWWALARHLRGKKEVWKGREL